MSKSDNELVFKIPNEEVKLGKIFRQLYNLATNNQIEDFSLTQSSLEQVFLVFARHQVNIE